MPRIIWVLMLIACSFLNACKKDNESRQPVKVTWDRDVCQECRMTISDPRFAAQVISPDGRGYRFDDIGCALNWVQTKEWKQQAKIWASDRLTQQWIDAKKANWSFGSNTPMGYGFSASMSDIENRISFEEVQHRVMTDQTLRHHHSTKRLGNGHE